MASQDLTLYALEGFAAQLGGMRVSVADAAA